MSSIEKLLIRGIRSFSPDSQNVIEFYTPVTIIVGHNGAGKTTIIECLKYATTGDLPPNSKGGAFVNDPKLSGDSEVKAQIRLKFRNVKGQSMVVTRSMQSTVKKNSKLEQKSLEGLLVTTDPSTGEQVSISTRCAELDAEIPLHLGVSRAVLENVIFCHQEESFWPLSEPSVLKKKFDDIFAATRYTRALDNLKSIKKDLVTELKLEVQKLEFLTSERDKARRVEANLSQCEAQMEETRARVSSLDVQIAAVSAGIDRSADDLEALNSLVRETERLEHDLQVTRQAQQDLSSTLTGEMSEDDATLQTMLTDLMDVLKGAQQTMSEYEETRTALLSKIESLTRDYSQHCTRRGNVQAQVSVLNGKRSDRHSLLLQLAEMFSIPCGSASLDSFSELMTQVAERIQFLRDRIVSLKSEMASEDSARQGQIQGALSRHASLEELRRSRRRQVDELQETLLRIEESLARLDENGDLLGDEFQEEMEIASEETELALTRDNPGHVKDLERQLAQLARERREAEALQDRIQRQMARFNQQAEVRARLSMKRAEIGRKAEQLERIVSEYASMTNIEVVSSFEVIEREFEGAQRERGEKTKAFQERNETLKGQLSSVSSKLDHCKSQILRRELHLRELEGKMCDISQVPLEVQIKRLELELTNLREKEALCVSSAAVYASFLADFEGSSGACACPVCEQAIGADIRGRVEAKLTSLSSSDKSGEGEKRQVEEKLAALHVLRPIQQEIDRIRTQELPELRAELGSLEDSELTLRCTTEEAQLELNGLLVEERRALLVKRKIEEGLRFTRELGQLKQELGQQERQLQGDENEAIIINLNDEHVNISGDTGNTTSTTSTTENTGNTTNDTGNTASNTTSNTTSNNNINNTITTTTLTPENAQNVLIQVQGKGRRCVEAMEKLNLSSRQRESEIQMRESRLRQRKELLSQVKTRRSERESLDRQRQESNCALETLKGALLQVQVDLEAAGAALKQRRDEREEWHRQGLAGLEVAQNSLDAALVPFTQLDALQAEIERLESSSVLGSLAALESAISDCELLISGAQRDLESHQSRATLRNKEAAGVQIRERAIRDNLRLRELRRRAADLETELSARLKHLQGIDRGTLQQSHSRAQMRRGDLLGDRAGLVGELRQLEESSNRLRLELANDYAHVTSDWQGQSVRVQALQLGSDDLEKYSRALDQAIMKYHALKMDEINAIIRELWTSTYQGSDIDTIEIRADHENSNANGRCYNYRVVMRKGAVDLDLRGRSSAGQRVLTCIIVRLALAEVFGLHCGILALDEPTTNLDRENIHSLAASLANIIKTRRAQSNFQLILITHDEEFVQLLGREECAEWYWRVFKDENSHSSIERQSITGILE